MDFKIFILSFVTLFLVGSIYNWESFKKAFDRGWNQWSTEKGE